MAIMLTVEEWKTTNREGLIPGPDESLTQFNERVDYCLHLKNHLPEEIPFSRDLLDKVDSVEEITGPLFDIAPSWIPSFSSNYQLMPWHGGCAWIFQLSEDKPASAFFQLRKNPLFSYSRKELVAHELSHVGRMVFDEPKYEEILAYQTSSSSFRQFFGPIVQYSIEAMIFVLTLFTLFVADLFVLLSGYPEVFYQMQWLKAVPLAMVLFAIGRLLVRQYTFKKAMHNLAFTKHPRPIIYRLTDREIEAFSKMGKDEIQAYIEKQKSPRWMQIKAVYPVIVKHL